MHARNEVVPLSATDLAADHGPTSAAAGPVAQAVPAAHKPPPSAKQVQVQQPTPIDTVSDKMEANATLNAEMASTQERRARLVQSQRRDTAFQLFYALFGVALMMVQMEYLWFANTKSLALPCPSTGTSDACPNCMAAIKAAGVAVPLQDGRMILHALRVLISCSTALLLYYTYRFYASEVEVMKIKNIVPPKATLLSSSLRRRLLIELVLLAVHPFPGLEAVDPRWPNLLVAASLLMFARVGLLLRVVQFRHSFNSSNGWFIGALTNVDFTVAFFIKSTLKNHPSRCILAFLVALLGVVGYALFVVERFLCAFVSGSCCQPMSFADALWSLVITILTIGYGDVVPQTAPGRAFAVAAGVSGMIATAVTIAVMSHYLVLTRSEHKVNAFLKKDENRRLINNHAARTIQAFVQLRATQRRVAAANGGGGAGTTSIAGIHGSSTSLGHSRGGAAAGKRVDQALTKAQHRAESKLFDVLRAYRQAKRRVNSQDVSDPMDKQMTMLEMMEVNVEYIRTKIEDLAENLHSAPLLSYGHNNNSNRSRRRLTGMTPSTSTTSLSGSTAAAQPAGPQHQQPQQPSPPTSTIHEVDEGTQLDDMSDDSRKHQHQHHYRSNLHHHNDGPSSSFTMTDKANSPTRLSAVQLQHSTDVQSSGPSMAVTMGLAGGGLTTSSALPREESFHESIPEWAILLEGSLQLILGQVAQVAAEVDAVKRRVNEHMDSVDAKLVDLERRIVVGDALREISRSKTSRALLKRDSAESVSHAVESGPSAFATIASAVVTSGAATNGNATAASVVLPRFRRMLSNGTTSSSSSSRRPSIQNFVTQKDLDEFHHGSNLDG